VRLEFYLAERIPRPKANSAPWRNAARDTSAWRLLLQIDSDDDLGLRWGECGTLYFGMRADDLRAERFERAVITWQC
jgi:uncharacterized protein YwqG